MILVKTVDVKAKGPKHYRVTTFKLLGFIPIYAEWLRVP